MGRLWKEWEVQYLNDCFEHQAVSTMENRLKRSWGSIRMKAKELGLERYKNAPKVKPVRGVLGRIMERQTRLHERMEAK